MDFASRLVDTFAPVKAAGRMRRSLHSLAVCSLVDKAFSYTRALVTVSSILYACILSLSKHIDQCVISITEDAREVFALATRS